MYIGFSAPNLSLARSAIRKMPFPKGNNECIGRWVPSGRIQNGTPSCSVSTAFSIVASLCFTSSTPSRIRLIGMILSQVRIAAVRGFLNISARATNTLRERSMPKIAMASHSALAWLGEKITAPSVGIFSLPTYCICLYE